MVTKQHALAAGICMEKLWVREGIVGLRTWNNERRVRYAERALAGVPLTAADHAGDAYIYFYMPYASKSLVPAMRHRGRSLSVDFQSIYFLLRASLYCLLVNAIDRTGMSDVCRCCTHMYTMPALTRSSSRLYQCKGGCQLRISVRSRNRAGSRRQCDRCYPCRHH